MPWPKQGLSFQARQASIFAVKRQTRFASLKPALGAVFALNLSIVASSYAASDAAESPKQNTSVKLVLQWDHQSQFAGYYMALDKGFYAEEGLDVTIVRGGPDVRSCEMVDEGKAEFCTSMLSTALEKKQEGLEIVEIAQLVNRCNFELVAWKSPESVKSVTLNRLEQLDKREITVWEHDFRLPYSALFEKSGISPRIKPQYYSLSLFMNHGADACSVMHYNEYHWLLQHGVKEESISVFPLWEYGVDLPEDGIYARENYYRNNPEICAAFARASLKGWKYAKENTEETLDAVMERVQQAKLATNRPHMRWMLTHILDSIFPGEGKDWEYGTLSKEQYQKACKLLIKVNAISSAPAYEDFIMDQEVQHVEP